jgi:hypothetical protein
VVRRDQRTQNISPKITQNNFPNHSLSLFCFQLETELQNIPEEAASFVEELLSLRKAGALNCTHLGFGFCDATGYSERLIDRSSPIRKGSRFD